MSYFNEEQEGHMKYLASLPREQKCKCGWYLWGKCYNDLREDGGNGYRERVSEQKPIIGPSV